VLHHAGDGRVLEEVQQLQIALLHEIAPLVCS
jgi:hypothetical protein